MWRIIGKDTTISELKDEFDTARLQGNVFNFLTYALMYGSYTGVYIRGLKAVMSKLGEMTGAEKAYVVTRLEPPNNFNVKKPDFAKIRALIEKLNESLHLERRILKAFWRCRTIEDMRREWEKAKEIKQDESFVLFVSVNPLDFRLANGCYQHDPSLPKGFLCEIADELSENHLKVIEQAYRYPPQLPVPENIGLCHAIGRKFIRSVDFDTAVKGMEYGVDPLKVEGANARLVEVVSLHVKIQLEVSEKRQRTD